MLTAAQLVQLLQAITSRRITANKKTGVVILHQGFNSYIPHLKEQLQQTQRMQYRMGTMLINPETVTISKTVPRPRLHYKIVNKKLLDK